MGTSEKYGNAVPRRSLRKCCLQKTLAFGERFKTIIKEEAQSKSKPN